MPSVYPVYTVSVRTVYTSYTELGYIYTGRTLTVYTGYTDGTLGSNGIAVTLALGLGCLASNCYFCLITSMYP